MRRAITLAVATLLNVGGFAALAQLPPSQAIQAPKAAADAVSGSSAPAAAPVSQSNARPAAKSSKKAGKTTKPAATVPPASASAEPSAAVEPQEPKAARRDPFESLVGRDKTTGEAAKNLPPGKAGLQVASLRLDGIVRSPGGMIAVVTNPQQRTYFLREGDQLYDGRVEKIAMDGVSFHEMGKDAFGKPVERQVNKRIYSSAGEQQ
jgi:Tfp pilus assembly protein PilP